MTPYGIVYSEIPVYYEKSIETAAKKCGIMSFRSMGKLYAAAFILSAILYTVTGIILKNAAEAVVCLIILCICSVFYIRTTVKRAEVRSKAKFTLSKTPIQIVFYDNCFVSTQPYSKTEFSYDEVAFCEENQGLLTIVINNGIGVYSIPCSTVVKGSYNTVCSILRDKLKSRYIFKGV